MFMTGVLCTVCGAQVYLNHKTILSKYVSIFYRENMTSFLNYVTATLRTLYAWHGSLYARLQTGRIMVWWCPSVRVSVRPTLRPSACFPHFSHTCFDILSWNFAHDFILMYYRSSLSVVTLCQFLKELCLFVNLEYW